MYVCVQVVGVDSGITQTLDFHSGGQSLQPALNQGQMIDLVTYLRWLPPCGSNILLILHVVNVNSSKNTGLGLGKDNGLGYLYVCDMRSVVNVNKSLSQ